LRALKKEIRDRLAKADTDEAYGYFRQTPASPAIGVLFSLFFDKEELIKWRAVSAFGLVVDAMAEKKMESARVIMRRLMWSLNDESGGIGWGSPEAMGEIMARNRTLAGEYHKILLSYAMEDMNFIEHEMLQRGVLWGIGRLGRKHPEYVRPFASHLTPFLRSGDSVIRGLAVWVVLSLGGEKVFTQALAGLREDPGHVLVYEGYILKSFPIAELAQQALKGS
jgi:hypothetical protein